MPARGGGPPNNGQRLSWLIGPASSMAGLAQTAQQWSVRAARSVCGWYHCTPLGGVRKVRTLKALAKATGIRHLLNRLNEALSVGLISLAEDGYRLAPKGKHFILNTLKPQKNGKKKRKLVKLRS